ncbi:putative histone H1-like HC2 [Collimonas arenae]|uniref:Putative histone H1-like HC2 n=1 Tax=Collimonas arenae TaxID=279058 RepID=A0A127PRT2_9BURK|nr:putative histone H1-like HC2 [Collimonas arenae]AMP10374.1 putative histone H1-like HC2 [Collimonas arenae]
MPSGKPTSGIKSLPDSKAKVKKAKLVRDSFTMPADEYQVLGDVKKLFLKAGLEVKKSELLRVGVALIRDLDLANLKLAVASLPPVKAGRPKKEK